MNTVLHMSGLIHCKSERRFGPRWYHTLALLQVFGFLRVPFSGRAARQLKLFSVNLLFSQRSSGVMRVGPAPLTGGGL